MYEWHAKSRFKNKKSLYIILCVFSVGFIMGLLIYSCTKMTQPSLISNSVLNFPHLYKEFIMLKSSCNYNTSSSIHQLVPPRVLFSLHFTLLYIWIHFIIRISHIKLWSFIYLAAFVIIMIMMTNTPSVD